MQNRVRELRTAAGLTQQQLAEQVRVSSRTIISLEKGQYNPSLLLGACHGKTSLGVCDVFGKGVSEPPLIVDPTEQFH